MSAYVRHEFRRGFMLGEEHLRKLNEIVSARVSGIDPAIDLKFEVRRADSFQYKTKDVDRVAREENVANERVLAVALRAERNDEFYFNLEFDHQDGVSLLIVGEDRDAVFLLFSDVRSYIDAEVAKRLLVDKRGIQFGGAIGSMLLFFVVLIAASASFTPASMEAALATNDVNEKLNFLINTKSVQRSGAFFGILFAGAALPMIFLTPLPLRILSMVYPTNCFLLGKQRTNLENRSKLVGNIFWIVVVGGLISLLTGLMLR